MILNMQNNTGVNMSVACSAACSGAHLELLVFTARLWESLLNYNQ